jgi:predicted  nucleic acid-binding Zn-ribbon protein
MGNPVQALRALQEIDKDLFRVNSELERLPAERASRQAILDNAAAVIEQKRQLVMECQVKVREHQGDVDTHQQRIRQLEKESMNNPDVSTVVACQNEVRRLRRQIEEEEREQYQHMETIERTKLEIEKFSERLEAEQATFEEFSRAVDEEMAEARARKEDLEAKRKGRLSDDLDPQVLELYERLLVARDGEALAMLDGGVCQCCYMQVPPNLTIQLARGDRVIQCSSCDRIMYLP